MPPPRFLSASVGGPDAPRTKSAYGPAAGHPLGQESASWAWVLDAIDSLPLAELATSAAFPLDGTATLELCSIRPGKRCSMHGPADRSAVCAMFLHFFRYRCEH